jgi:hypothetical protein
LSHGSSSFSSVTLEIRSCFLPSTAWTMIFLCYTSYHIPLLEWLNGVLWMFFPRLASNGSPDLSLSRS